MEPKGMEKCNLGKKVRMEKKAEKLERIVEKKREKDKEIKTELGKGESQKICCFEIREIEIRSEQKNILTEIMERRIVWKQKRMEKWRRERKDIKGNM